MANSSRSAIAIINWFVIAALIAWAVGGLITGGAGPVRIGFGIAGGLLLIAGAGSLSLLAQADSRRAYASLLLTVAGAAATFGAAPLAIFVLPALIPRFYFAVPVLPASIGTAALTVGAAASVSLNRIEQWQGVVVVLAVSAVVSILVGVWLSQVFELNATQRDMINELTESRTLVRELARAAGAAEERAQIARDVHDGMAQQVSASVMLMRSVEESLQDTQLADRVRTARQFADRALAECRFLIAQQSVRPDGSLTDYLSDVLHLFEAAAGAKTRWDVQIDESSMSRLGRLTVQRIISESLSNCLKHARATEVVVTLRPADDPSTVELTVQDNGVGIDRTDIELTEPEDFVGSDAGDLNGFGLRSMHSRVTELGGELSIESIGDIGTTVRALVPKRPMSTDAERPSSADDKMDP